MSTPATAISHSPDAVSVTSVHQHPLYDHTPQDGETIHCTVSPNPGTTLLPVIPRGSSPAGTMHIKLSPIPFPGSNTAGCCFGNATNLSTSRSRFPSIVITYNLPAGVQMSPYHTNPGMSYSSTCRTAYLPNTNEGCMLLTRFKYAFWTGHMFTIGRSLTNGLDNQITWTVIPNKTSMAGGPFGFPDPHYITDANVVLNYVGIPSADVCFSILDQLNSRQQQVSQQSLRLHQPILTASAPPASPSISGFFPSPAAASTSGGTAGASSTPSQMFVGDEIIPYTAPDSLAGSFVSSMSDNLLQPLSEDDIFELLSSSEECALCLEPLLCHGTSRSVHPSSSSVCKKLGNCSHIFHQDCIDQLLSHHGTKCPTCRQPIIKPRGKCPSGTMQIHLIASQPCPGFPNAMGTYSIKYFIPSGYQKSYHDQPGMAFTGTSRVAYVPNTVEGCKLLQRLKYAWKHGLIFQIGTSLTTGMHNQVTWTSIHHKTNLNFSSSIHDPHSFPDDNYINNCNSSLDALHVPPADECL